VFSLLHRKTPKGPQHEALDLNEIEN